MAILKTDDSEVEVQDGTEVIDAAEELGVSIGCGHGMCGACEVAVVEGMNNLNPLTDAEKEMDLDEGHRLMCQCTISGGEVKIEN